MDYDDLVDDSRPDPRDDPRVRRLNELLSESLPSMTGRGMKPGMALRQMLWHLAVDDGVGEDVSDVSEAEWMEALALEPGEKVSAVLGGFVEAGFLHRSGGRLLVSDWESVKNDERAAAVRRFIWSRDDEDDPVEGRADEETASEAQVEAPSRVTYLAERRDPGRGWPQQEQFISLINRIDDEGDLLVKFFRSLRMLVGPGLVLSEHLWEQLLVSAHAVVDVHQWTASEAESGEPE